MVSTRKSQACSCKHGDCYCACGNDDFDLVELHPDSIDETNLWSWSIPDPKIPNIYPTQFRMFRISWFTRAICGHRSGDLSRGCLFGRELLLQTQGRRMMRHWWWGVSPARHGGTPIAGWFLFWEHLTKIWTITRGYPYFRKPPYFFLMGISWNGFCHWRCLLL